MKKATYWLIVFLVALATLVAVGSIWYWTNFLFALAFVTAVGGGLLYQGLVRVVEDPPHVALVTVLAERVLKLRKEGWTWCLLFPWIQGLIPVRVDAINLDRPPLKVRTPDNAEVAIPIDLTLLPAWRAKDKDDNWVPRPDLIINYLNSGGREGVIQILTDIADQRLREWARSKQEGPATWEEAQEAGDHAVDALLKTIVSDLDRIPSSIPTSLLFAYFNKPRRDPTEKEKAICGEGWSKVEATLEEEGKDEIEKAIRARRKSINEARRGGGYFIIEPLGCALVRLNIGEVLPLGELAKQAELKAVEEVERAGEVFETETDIEKARLLMKKVEEAGQRITLIEAFRIIMEWKTTREGRGFTIPGVAGELVQLVAGRLAGRPA